MYENILQSTWGVGPPLIHHDASAIKVSSTLLRLFHCHDCSNSYLAQAVSCKVSTTLRCSATVKVQSYGIWQRPQDGLSSSAVYCVYQIPVEGAGSRAEHCIHQTPVKRAGLEQRSEMLAF